MHKALGWLVFGCALQACHGASNDPGLRADLYVYDAQFVPGPMPETDGTGPDVVSLRVPHDVVTPGEREEHLTGALAPAATAVLLGLEPDDGYWIIGAGLPSLEEPDLPTFDAQLAFARGLGLDTLKLRVRAVDARGRAGRDERVELVAAVRLPAAELLVTLDWDSAADLDLHVVDPSGAEVWAGNINSAKAPPVGSLPADPNAWRSGGILDIDSNADCIPDSRRRENVSWQAAPSAGDYRVRVAAASLCTEAAAHFRVEVWLHGERLSQSRGTALPSDLRHGAGRGDGVSVLSFKVP